MKLRSNQTIFAHVSPRGLLVKKAAGSPALLDQDLTVTASSFDRQVINDAHSTPGIFLKQARNHPALKIAESGRQ